MIGASATTIEQYIDENTLSYDYGRCKSLQIIKDLPRASSLYVDKSTNKIISIGIGGVAKVKTLHGIDLDNTLEEVRNIIGPEHKFIPNAEYTGHPIKRENMGDLVIVWADPKKPGTNHEASRGIRFETWRSSPGLSSIEVGEFMANGDTVCDL